MPRTGLSLSPKDRRSTIELPNICSGIWPAKTAREWCEEEGCLCLPRRTAERRTGNQVPGLPYDVTCVVAGLQTLQSVLGLKLLFQPPAE